MPKTSTTPRYLRKNYAMNMLLCSFYYLSVAANSSIKKRLRVSGRVFKDMVGISETYIVQKTGTLQQVNLIASNEYTEATEIKILNFLKDHVGGAMQIRFEYLNRKSRKKTGKFKF
ncbi:hypothetical protein LCGC14_0700400 [marine sediment metagenome]|uniref:Uncharacterized protein n=1 Tax=marine sediment metagenome TaxID=412755 RepID=A0A0F9QHZ3_9ZZZZ